MRIKGLFLIFRMPATAGMANKVEDGAFLTTDSLAGVLFLVVDEINTKWALETLSHSEESIPY